MLILITFAIVPHLLVIAAGIILWTARLRRKSELIIRLFIGWLLFSATAFAGPWALTSTYFPYIYLVAMLALSAVAILKKTNKAYVQDHISFSYTKHLKLVVIVALAILNFLVLKGKVTVSDEAIDMESPVRNGTYYVLQGGNSFITNGFHRRLFSQNYAIDIVQLNRWGNRATNIYSSNLEDFYIFGDTLYSPVEGTITRNMDGMKDQPPGIMSYERALGNYYFIRYGPHKYVILGHLKKGSVWLEKGTTVSQGTPLGLVGNSGRSIEPHLHLQAVEIKERDGRQHWSPIPIRIDGRFYSLNDTWKVQQ